LKASPFLQSLRLLAAGLIQHIKTPPASSPSGEIYSTARLRPGPSKAFGRYLSSLVGPGWGI